MIEQVLARDKAASDARWRIWRERGAEDERRTTRIAGAVGAVAGAVLIIWLVVQLV